MKEKFYTVKDFCDIFDLHFNTVYKMVRERKIEHRRIGTKILFSQETIDNFGKVEYEETDN